MNPLAILMLAAGAYLIISTSSNKKEKKEPQKTLPQKEPPQAAPLEKQITSLSQLDSLPINKNSAFALSLSDGPASLTALVSVDAAGMLTVEGAISNGEKMLQKQKTATKEQFIGSVKTQIGKKDISKGGVKFIGPFPDVGTMLTKLESILPKKAVKVGPPPIEIKNLEQIDALPIPPDGFMALTAKLGPINTGAAFQVLPNGNIKTLFAVFAGAKVPEANFKIEEINKEEFLQRAKGQLEMSGPDSKFYFVSPFSSLEAIEKYLVG